MFNYWWFVPARNILRFTPAILANFKESLMIENRILQRGNEKIKVNNILNCGGGQVYFRFLMSLGLVYISDATKTFHLTWASDSILNGKSSIKILTNQILKYQFPSTFSIIHEYKVNERFKIHPFWFLLKLLSDNRIQYLTLEEIAKIIITEAENESNKCYEKIVARLIEFRNFGDNCLEKDFAQKYTSSKGNINFQNPYSHLFDIANTIINWLEYTQLIFREDSKIKILDEQFEEVKKIISKKLKFINRPEEHERFQRQYGLDLTHTKDTRNLLQTKNVTDFMIADIQVKKYFISIALSEPIATITTNLIDRISEQSGIKSKIVEEILPKMRRKAPRFIYGDERRKKILAF